MRRQGAIFRLGEKVVSVEKVEHEEVTAVLESGKQVYADCLLYAVGRQPNTDLLNLEAAGLSVDVRGRLAVNLHYQTAVPHIYAAGDVIGFPSLAASSMEQGRLAGCHMFGDRAAEIIHIGQAVMALGGTIEYFRDTVFNYPTMAEAYKIAALNGLNKL